MYHMNPLYKSLREIKSKGDYHLIGHKVERYETPLKYARNTRINFNDVDLKRSASADKVFANYCSELKRTSSGLSGSGRSSPLGFANNQLIRRSSPEFMVRTMTPEPLRMQFFNTERRCKSPEEKNQDVADPYDYSNYDTSNSLYGTGLKWWRQNYDLNQMPNYAKKARNYNKVLGDKISNMSKETLAIKGFNSSYHPKSVARSHEIGAEHCDKMRGVHLMQYVRRI